MSFLDSIGSVIGSAGGGVAGGLLGGSLSGGQAGGLAMDIATGGAYSNTQAAMDINRQNIGFAQKQMDFQQTNSNTAYQRAVADMRAAGLNPMLAYSQGGASVPQGTTPSLVNPEPGNIGAGLVNTAKGIGSFGADLSKTVSTIDNTKKDTELTQEKIATQQEQTHNLQQDTENKKVQKDLIKHQAKKTQAEAKSKGMEADLKSQRFSWDKNLQKYDAGAERAGPVIKGAIESVLGTKLLKRILGGSQTTAKPRAPSVEEYNLDQKLKSQGVRK